ncbi:MAG TPA: T9SS type A sorting domain-containing protein [Bacteroidetes bacterium]|nr:T9SS type A sorting domain-containing protein [Bacteroidota bacterium]
MKRPILITLFSFFALFAFSQAGFDSPDTSNSWVDAPPSVFQQPPRLSIFPNPAIHYISINEDKNVKSITIFNLVGRKIKTFENIRKNEQYDISTLHNGMYLVQITDYSNKILATQRISKR